MTRQVWNFTLFCLQLLFKNSIFSLHKKKICGQVKFSDLIRRDIQVLDPSSNPNYGYINIIHNDDNRTIAFFVPRLQIEIIKLNDTFKIKSFRNVHYAQLLHIHYICLVLRIAYSIRYKACVQITWHLVSFLY